MRYLLPFVLLCICKIAIAQERPNYKFGNVNPDDFKKTIYSLDSNAAAVVLSDVGSTEFIGNTKGGFSLLFKRHMRAHVLNKNGYDISNVSIYLLTVGQAEENLENLKAVTYNLENGKVVQTKLEVKSGVFKDVINKNLVVKKFTFPNVKEGSIIEYEYKIESDFYQNLQSWTFQGEYPVIWSEYNVGIPSFFTYATLSQGYHAFVLRDQKSSFTTFNLADLRGTGATDRLSFNSEVNNYRWAMQNIPALKEESYTSTIRNHVSKIEFQLSSVGYPFTPRQVMSTWPAVTKLLLEDESFGAQLVKDNGWMKDVISEATKNSSAPLDQAKGIFAWVRDNFTCTNHNRRYMEGTLKNVLKDKNGNEAEINLLLTALLRKAGMQADPILLSTRSNGYTHAIYPLLDRFNYVICRLALDDKEYFLDASEPQLGFGRLNYECYNGHARIINPEATPLEMTPDLLKEESYTAVFLMNDDKGNMVGTIKQTPGYVMSTGIRDEIKEKGLEAYTNAIKKKPGNDFSVSNIRIDSLKIFDEPVGISYDIDYVGEKEDIIYFSPMMGEGFKENPFKSAQRFYPVEMPFSIDETFNMQLEIPAGYVVEELPKQAVVKYNEENDAFFEYRISTSGNMISMRSRLMIKKVLFQPDEYEILREFFSHVVMKHSEQIVFKKKK